jgi:hypothetical protein
MAISSFRAHRWQIIEAISKRSFTALLEIRQVNFKIIASGSVCG